MIYYGFNPSQSIPNNPFYYPLEQGLQSISGPLVVGSGFTIDYATGTISATGGGGGGGPVLVTAPIVNLGTINLPNIGILIASTSRKGAVQIGANIDVLNGVISVQSATTVNTGVVQLNNTAASTSELEALTANEGFLLQQQINALRTADGLVFTGTFSAATSQMLTVSSAGSAAGFTVGTNLLAPSFLIESFFVIVSEPGLYTPPGSTTPVNAKHGDWFLCNGTTWEYLRIGSRFPLATETNPGAIQIATQLEVDAGTNATNAVTPATASVEDLKKTILANKGDLITATSPELPAALSVGADGTLLTACSICSSGLSWQTPAGAGAGAIPCACVTGKGSLISGTGPASPLALALGTGGQLLSVNTTCPLGLEWLSISNPAIPCSTITGKGSIITGTAAGAPIALPVGSDNQILIACSSFSTGLTWVSQSAAPIPSACITAKGALVTGTAPGSPAGLNPGVDGTVLTACTGCALGLTWRIPSASTSIPCTAVTGKGAIIIGSAPNTPSALPVGPNNTVLTSCSTDPRGLCWATPIVGDSPVGMVQWFAGSAVPTGWLVADGSAVSRTTYANLFATVGTTYGVGNGSTTFNLPDLRGQWIRGWDGARGCDPLRVFGSTQQGSVSDHCHVICQNFVEGCLPVSFAWCRPVIGSTQYCSFNANPIQPPGPGWGYTEDNNLTPTRNTVENVAMLPCIKWQVTLAASQPNTGIPVNCVTSRGALIVGIGAGCPITMSPVTSNGKVLAISCIFACALQWQYPISNPGLDGLVLTACSQCALGTVWDKAGSSVTTCAASSFTLCVGVSPLQQCRSLPIQTLLPPVGPFLYSATGSYCGFQEITGCMWWAEPGSQATQRFNQINYSNGTGLNQINACIPFTSYFVGLCASMTFNVANNCNNNGNYTVAVTAVPLFPLYQ